MPSSEPNAESASIPGQFRFCRSDFPSAESHSNRRTGERTQAGCFLATVQLSEFSFVYPGAVNRGDGPSIVPQLIERPLDPHENFNEQIRLLRLFQFADQFIEKPLQCLRIISVGQGAHFSPVFCRCFEPGCSSGETRSLRAARREIPHAGLLKSV
jgi:hypothetical protein